jgi:flagellar motor switch protein FliN/FliY
MSEESAEIVESNEAGQPSQPAQADRAPSAGETGGGGGLDLVLDVPLRVTVEVGGARMHVREVLQLSKGSVVELDRASGEPADVLVNGRVVARGELTVVDDHMAVRIVEVVGAARGGHAS